MNKDFLLSEIKNKLSSIPDLVSLTIVGSHGDPNKPFEKTNDIDILFLIKKLDGKSFLEIKSCVDGLVMGLSSSAVKVWPEYRIGPVKATYETGEPIGIMLHALIFDIESLENYNKIAPFVTLDWLNFNSVFGKNLKEVYDFRFPTTEDLLHAPRHSFDYYEKMIKGKIYILLDIEVENNELKYITHTYEYPKDQWGELYADILKKLLLNILIVYRKENKIWKEEEILQMFIELFPNLFYLESDLREIIGLKKKIRNNELPDFDPAKCEPKVLSIISEIKKAISNV